jgi:hypothetical protein
MGRGTANGFQITQFALADDEVDYDLWNPAHPLGSQYYGIVIENMPVTEAVPDETQSMKYKLLTLPRGVNRVPYLQLSKETLEVKRTTDTQNFVEVRTYFAGTPNTNDPSDNLFNRSAGYMVILLDSTYVTMAGINGTTTQVINQGNQMTPATSLTAVLTNPASPFITIKFSLTERGLNLSPDAIKSTKVIITGNETGGRAVLPLTIINDLTSTTATT